jgi:hypothetical protein
MGLLVASLPGCGGDDGDHGASPQVTPGAPPPATESTPADADESLARFTAGINAVCAFAQPQIYAAQQSVSEYAPDTDPDATWAQFHEDQARIAREAAERFRQLAPLAPDPDEWARVVDEWASTRVDWQEALAAAARRPDGGDTYRDIRDSARPDVIREYLLSLPTRHGCVVIAFGPDAGR